MTGFDVIVGNPPFLNQLESTTATDRGIAEIIRQNSNGAIKAYTDVSATFLLASTGIVGQRGRVALVQPQSFLVAKDAASVRSAVVTEGALVHLWVSNEQVFDNASTYTCAPTIDVGAPRTGALARSATGRYTPLASIDIDNDDLAGAETWGALAAAAKGIPEVPVRSSKTIGDYATATADFRDQYYGLSGFLVDDPDLPDRADWSSFPPIVTTGLIDLGVCHWGSRTTRILKSRWRAPRIDRRRMEREGELGPWIAQRLMPKVILATQTSVIEIFVDAEGTFVPGVPLVSVYPRDDATLWHIAAALASPVCTAVAMQRYAGAGLTADAIKLSATQTLGLPVPSNGELWDRAAALFARFHELPRARRDCLEEFAECSVAAYEAEPALRKTVVDWWLNRLPADVARENATDEG